MDASQQMSLGNFLETALQIRAAKDDNRQYFLAKGDTRRADKCHSRARNQFKGILNSLDPQKVVYLYPYIELKVPALQRDWFVDIAALCEAQPKWKDLTCEEIRSAVLHQQSEIRKHQIIKAEESNADDARLAQFGPPAPDEPPDDISDPDLLITVDEFTEPQLAPDPAPDPVQIENHLRKSWERSGGHPAIFKSRIWGPLPQNTWSIRPESPGIPDPVLDPNCPNALSGVERMTPLSEIHPTTESGKNAFAYVKWVMNLPDDKLIEIFGKPDCGHLPDIALKAFEAYAKSTGLARELKLNTRTEAKIRQGLMENTELRALLDQRINKVKAIKLARG